MENNLRWKTNSNGKQLLIEYTFWWKITFDGRQPLIEDDLKTPFDERQDNHLWKTTIIDGRGDLMLDDI